MFILENVLNKMSIGAMRYIFPVFFNIIFQHHHIRKINKNKILHYNNFYHFYVNKITFIVINTCLALGVKLKFQFSIKSLNLSSKGLNLNLHNYYLEVFGLLACKVSKKG